MDEVQTGIGRTGKLFAYEWSGVTPDIMGLAKGLGGGFPIGACLATEAAAAGMVAGSHGSTFGGNPLAMAVGNAVLDIMLDDEFLADVRRKSLLLKQKLAEIKDLHGDVIEEVRGDGLLLGLKCRVPNTEFVAALLREKLLAVAAGDNVVRLLPPLIVQDAQISEACTRLSTVCAVFNSQHSTKTDS
jgi:acetylornithine/N-succinyldiaminopimelate aminotransferase